MQTIKRGTVTGQTGLISALAAFCTAVPAWAQNPVFVSRPVVIAAAPAPPSKPVPLPFYYVDFKDAPIRAAVEALCGGARANFSIDPNVAGTLTLRGGGSTVDDFLARASQMASMPFRWTHESDVYILRPRSDVPKPPEEPFADGPAPASLQAVPRRAAGVLRATGGVWKALLITGVGASAEAKLVSIGDTVNSRFPAIPLLKVEKISAREVILVAPSGTERVSVPVRRANEEAPPKATEETKTPPPATALPRE